MIVNGPVIPLGIGIALKEAREKAGLTQKEISDIIGVSPETISRWENHLEKPDDIEVYTKYNELSGFSVLYLMGKSSYKSDEEREADEKTKEETKLSPEEIEWLATHLRAVKEMKMTEYEDVFAFQKEYKTKQSREKALREMTDDQIDKLVASCGTKQGKIYYASFKSKLSDEKEG